MDAKGDLVPLGQLRTGNFKVKSASENINMQYEDFFKNLRDIAEFNLARSAIQSPFRRLLLEINKFISRKSLKIP